MTTVLPLSLRVLMLLALISTNMGLAGCSRPVARDAVDESALEMSFADQAREVREGRSNQIRLDHVLVSDEDLTQLEGLEPTLARINLSHSKITDAGLARMSQLENLEQLRLASPNITDAGLAQLPELKKLRFLHLIDMPITDAGLDELHGLTSLESLYLDGTRVTDEGIGRLVAAMPGVHLHIDDHHHRLDPHGEDHKH